MNTLSSSVVDFDYFFDQDRLLITTITFSLNDVVP